MKIKKYKNNREPNCLQHYIKMTEKMKNDRKNVTLF